MREVRRHAGMILPAPVQAAMAAALGDDDHVAEQKAHYRARRLALLDAVATAGLEQDPDSVAGLYLWLRSGSASSWEIVDRLAERGILVAPGSFYGPAGEGYVRMALTATDERVQEAVTRLVDGGSLR